MYVCACVTHKGNILVSNPKDRLAKKNNKENKLALKIVG